MTEPFQPDPEVPNLDANPEVPPRETLPDGIALVVTAITSLDGGVNGANPYIELRITDVGDGVIQYILSDRETGTQQEFVVTVTAVA